MEILAKQNTVRQTSELIVRSDIFLTDKAKKIIGLLNELIYNKSWPCVFQYTF